MEEILKRLRNFKWYKDLVVFPIYYASRESYERVCVLLTGTDDCDINTMVKVMSETFKGNYQVSHRLYDDHADFFIDLNTTEKGETTHNGETL